MNNEKWVPIRGWEGKYFISNLGRVRHISGRIRKARVNRFGYERVSFHESKDRVLTFQIHRLVALHFLPISEKPYVNHIDGNKRNNSVDNLEWVTPKENCVHASKVGLAPKGEKNGMSKLTPNDVSEILILSKLNEGKKQNSPGYLSKQRIADMFGVSGGLVGHIRSGLIWSHLTGIKKQEAE